MKTLHKFLQNSNTILDDKYGINNETERHILCKTMLLFLSTYFKISKGIIFLNEGLSANNRLIESASINKTYKKDQNLSFSINNGLPGACIKFQKKIVIKNVPKAYFKMDFSSLPTQCQLVLIPLVFDGVCIGVLEIALLSPLNSEQDVMLENLCGKLAKDIFIINQRAGNNLNHQHELYKNIG